LPKKLTAPQRVGLVDASVLEAREMLLPGPVHDAQLAVLKVQALEGPVSEEDAPARARVLVSLRLAWAKSSGLGIGCGARLTSRQSSSTQAPHMACEFLAAVVNHEDMLTRCL